MSMKVFQVLRLTDCVPLLRIFQQKSFNFVTHIERKWSQVEQYITNLLHQWHRQDFVMGGVSWVWWTEPPAALI